MTATAQNRISTTGYSYDTAGNMTAASGATYSYDAENHLTSTAGVTYTYDGDGKRVQKSNGPIYWYGTDGSVLDETDLTGSTTNGSFNEYVFFGGKRIARRDSSNNVFYYAADHLGTSRVIAQVPAGQTTATLCYDADFYPFGGERSYTNTCAQNYKFTGKERDSESNLDNFGARYDSSSMGRFMSPDPIWVKGDRMLDAQRLNLYTYVRNNPLRLTDVSGMDVTIGNCPASATVSMCFAALQRGLSKDDRSHVHLVEGNGKNGFKKGEFGVTVDADYKSDSKNFQVLKTLANDHSAMARIDVYAPTDSFNVRVSVSWNAKTGYSKLTTASMTPGDAHNKNGQFFVGYTFFPPGKDVPGPYSEGDFTDAVINSSADDITAAMHHELRHVFLGDFGRSALQARHGYGDVDQQTADAEREALENEKEK